ncbi:MAG: DUF4157 domain-containing protein [Saprospiraceae bacterium]
MKQTATPTKTPAHPSSQPFFGRQAGSVLASEQAEATFFGPAPFIQAKLTIGAPDDPYEREADAVAEQVVQRMSAPASEMEEKEQIQPKIQRFPLTVQRKCAACEEEEKVQKKEEEKPEEMEGPIQRKPIFESNGDEEPPPGVQPAGPMVQRKCAACEQEEQGAVQRKPSGGGEMTASADVASRISHSKGGGSPLPESVQSAMGGALGADLSGVRVHTDSRAVQLNRDLGAQAFTHGSDVYFGAGKFQPGTGEGDRLLAHELVHVGQQGGGKRRLQKFDSPEHYILGHQGTREQGGGDRMVDLATDYSLPFGDVVAMAGDYFENIQQMREFAANPVRTGEKSREELDYVREVKVHRRQDRASAYSEEAIRSVDQRYYRLAMNNRSHFPFAQTADYSRTLPARLNDWINNMHSLPNAHAAYRRWHIQALWEAYNAGFSGQSENAALASEAFSAHYLTDSFAGGHVMTPRDSITTYWNEKVPMFNYNLKGYIAERLAEVLEKELYWGAMSEDAVYHGMFGIAGSLETITAILDEKGHITFGDVVSGAVHDYFNERGASALINGQAVRLFGDMNLDRGDERNFAVQAVRASYEEVLQAWRIGRSQASITDLFNLAPSGLFAADQLLPSPDPNATGDDRPLNWEHPNADALLNDGRMADAFAVFGREKAGEFEAAVNEREDLDEAKKRAFISTVVQEMRDNPVKLMRKIINWTPDTGGGFAGHNQDDNAMDYYQQAVSTPNGLKSLSVSQRVSLIKNVIDGYTSGSEEQSIMQLFESATPDERRTMYRQIEGHSWNGDFVEGWLVDDDDLWNELDSDDLSRLKVLLNEAQA